MLAGTISHGLLVLILFVWLDAGFYGIVLATGLQFLVRFIVVFCLVTFGDDVRKHKDVYLFSWESCNNIIPLFHKSLASLALGVWGWWSFDIFTLMSTYINTTAAGTQTMMRSIGLITFMMPMGFSVGAGIMIGKSIGQKNTNLALQYYRVGQVAMCFLSILQIGILFCFEDQIIAYFTFQEHIKANMKAAWPLLLVHTFVGAT